MILKPDSYEICSITSDEHSAKVKSFMLDIMCPLISESDTVSHELLDIILINVVEPNKTQRRNAYALAKELINKCADTLEPYIQAVIISISALLVVSRLLAEISNCVPPVDSFSIRFCFWGKKNRT